MVIGLILTLVFTLTGGDDDTLEEPDTFTLSGTIRIKEDTQGHLLESGGWTCADEYEFDDIAEGIRVTVYDANSTVRTFGRLGQGEEDGFYCILPITVPNVPAGHDLYQIEVSHRGKIAFTEQEGRAGRVSLTLG